MTADRASGAAACGLAHRRLAILDPEPRSNQPFSDAHGRQLVYNGEIYNFRELRAELSKLRPGYAWRTSGDTEVLLVAYDAWAEGCVARFDGMFAFAIWNAPAQSLFIARDRMGQKPLYLAFAGNNRSNVGAIAFASELPALRALRWVDATIDDAAIGHYLRWGYIPAPLTIYRGCEKLPPGRWMRQCKGRGGAPILRSESIRTFAGDQRKLRARAHYQRRSTPTCLRCSARMLSFPAASTARSSPRR